jgi:hypothetical protein
MPPVHRESGGGTANAGTSNKIIIITRTAVLTKPLPRFFVRTGQWQVGVSKPDHEASG